MDYQNKIVNWFDVTAGEDFTGAEGLAAIQSGSTVVLHDGAADNNAARQSRSYPVARGAESGRTVALQYQGIARVTAGGTVAADQLAVVNTVGKYIALTPADLRPGDHVVGRFLTGGSADAKVLLDLDAGFEFTGASTIVDGSTTTETLTGARTLTVAELVGGDLVLDPGGSARTVTSPTAALLVAAGLGVGDRLTSWVKNDADAAETITFAGGAGVTIETTETQAAQNETAELIFIVRDAGSGTEAVDLYIVAHA